MDWGIYLLVTVVSAVLGFAGGHAAVLTDRRRRPAAREASGTPDAAFSLEHLEGQTWSVVNVGSSDAALVSVLPLDDSLEHWPPKATPGSVETATSELLPTLRPGASVGVWLSRHEAGQRLIVSWTSATNVRMGPVTLVVPPPR